MAYRIIGEKFGTVRIEPHGTVTQEALKKSSKVTSNPIETGSNIDDHILNNPEGFSLSGSIVGDGDMADRLDRMWRENDIVTYAGKSRADDLAITALNITNTPGNKKGFEFSLTFQKLQFGEFETVPGGKVPMMSDKDFGSGSSSNGGIGSGGTQSASSATLTDADYYSYVNSYDGTAPGSSTPSYSGR